MGWVVHLVLRRAYRRLGIFFWDQWQECGQLLGIRFEIVPMRGEIRAFRLGRVIFIRCGMSAIETAWWAWHEIAHVLLHPGNLLKPIGDHVQAKEERQADQFASLFPIWDVPDVTFETEPMRVVSWDVESERRYLGCLWGGGV